MAKRFLLSSKLTVFVAALLYSILTSTAAHAVLIEINGASFTPGTGYGVDGSETSSPTLLDVQFSTSGFIVQSFSLDTVGQSETFDFGTVNFLEPNSGGGIQAAETDNLGVIADLIFTSPLGLTEMVSAIGAAITGSVSDDAVDYTLTWTPLLVNFGIGGQFQISLLDLSFSGQGIQTQTATITLLALPQSVTTAIPEPATFFLLGIGLVALGALARRRRV